MTMLWIRLVYYVCFILSCVTGFAQASITIGTYNLHNGKNIKGLHADLAALPQVDVWAFQEVMFSESALLPEFRHLFERYNFVFAQPVAMVDVENRIWEGHVIASRFPILSTGLFSLEGNMNKSRRAIWAIIQTPAGKILTVNTDHDVEFKTIGYEERKKNVASLIHGIQSLSFDGPQVVLGDFNTADSWANFRNGYSGRKEVLQTSKDMATRGWSFVPSSEAEPYTLEALGIYQQLDLIFTSNMSNIKPWHRYEQRAGSDHFPIYFETDLYP